MKRWHGERVGVQPAQGTEPDEQQGTDAGGDQAGQQDQGEGGAGEPGGLEDDHCSDDRRAEDGGQRREARCGPEHLGGLVGDLAAGQPDEKHGHPSGESNERRLRPEHQAQADGGQRRDGDTRQLVGCRECAGRQAVGRLMTAVTGQPRYGESDDESCDQEHW
nr:hypothetical protein GCM10020092_080600 [Actinoplanes digitatis]